MIDFRRLQSYIRSLEKDGHQRRNDVRRLVNKMQLRGGEETCDDQLRKLKMKLEEMENVAEDIAMQDLKNREKQVKEIESVQRELEAKTKQNDLTLNELKECQRKSSKIQKEIESAKEKLKNTREQLKRVTKNDYDIMKEHTEKMDRLREEISTCQRKENETMKTLKEKIENIRNIIS